MADTEYRRQDEKYQLKPCPFCGSKAVGLTDDDYSNYWVHCSDCFAQSDAYFTLSDAADAWNKRAGESNIDAEAWNNALHGLVQAVSKISRLVKGGE